MFENYEQRGREFKRLVNQNSGVKRATMPKRETKP
jgi:hypothetical protein